MFMHIIFINQKSSHHSIAQFIFAKHPINRIMNHFARILGNLIFEGCGSNSTRISTVHFHRLSCHVIRQTCVPDTDSSVLGQHHIVYFWGNLVWIDFIGGLQDHETNKFQFSDSRGTDSRKCIKVLGCVSSGPHVDFLHSCGSTIPVPKCLRYTTCSFH